jgi:diadenylate cyclase
MIMNYRKRRVISGNQKEIDILIKTLNRFSKNSTGALMVLRGKDPVVRHLEGGVNLNGEISEALLGSIFMAGSPGHDGAVIVIGNRVTAFSCYLPLSKNLGNLQKPGTRHAAALGLSERTDALCLVVSEETGTISVARRGTIRPIKDMGELSQILDSFYQEITPLIESKPWKSFFSKNYKEKVIAVTVTFFLWFFFVHEARTDYRTYMVPVEYEKLPHNLVVQESEPPEIEVTFSGPRRAFYFVDKSRININITLFDVKAGTIKRSVTRSDITAPDGLLIENIQPNQVILHIGSKNP